MFYQNTNNTKYANTLSVTEMNSDAIVCHGNPDKFKSLLLVHNKI